MALKSKAKKEREREKERERKKERNKEREGRRKKETKKGKKERRKEEKKRNYHVQTLLLPLWQIGCTCPDLRFYYIRIGVYMSVVSLFRQIFKLSTFHRNILI